MLDSILSWSWISIILFGSFHGLNPAMGWLFAVSLGLQERSSRAVVAALGPIALGHAISVAMVVGVVWLLGTVLPQALLMALGGLTMVGFAGYKVISRFRHPAWVGMRVNARDLVVWSFVMATAHGAGLMLLPPIMALRKDAMPEKMAQSGHHAHHIVASDAPDPWMALLGVGVHTVALFTVTGVVALVVYRKVGVDILRRAWINMDMVWVGVMALAGFMTLGYAAWSASS